MTTARRFGTGCPFSEWLRRQKDIDSVIDGITANDIDLTLHKYKNVVDNQGSRDVNLMMCLEIKTHNAMPNEYQRQTIFFQHQLLCPEWRERRIKPGTTCVDSTTGRRATVWHFGWYVLSIPGDEPDDRLLKWCRFDEHGDLMTSLIDTEYLKEILRFDVRPDRLEPLNLRRHHKVRTVVVDETMPLGFTTQRLITLRS